jgi:alkylation response protein AidB-like acyl-CoA dehydrogenase
MGLALAFCGAFPRRSGHLRVSYDFGARARIWTREVPAIFTFLETVGSVILSPFKLSPYAESLRPFIADAALKLRSQSSDWKAWREFLAPSGLCGRDIAANSTTDFDVFSGSFLLAAYSVDLRDVSGIGHARFLTVARDDRFRAVIDRVANNTAHTTFVSSEKTSGSNLREMTTRAERHADCWVITGEKDFIARHRQATHYLVLCNSGHGIVSLLVESSANGLHLTDRQPIGLSGVSWGAIQFNGVKVPLENLITDEATTLSHFTSHFSFWRTNMAATAVGAAAVAVATTEAFIANRQTPRGRLSTYSHLQRDFGLHKARLLAAWALIRDVAASPVEEREMAALALKGTAIDDAHNAIDACIQAVGARGYDRDEFDFARRLNDIAGLRISSGPTDTLLCRLGRLSLT